MKNHVTDMAPIKGTTPYMPRTTPYMPRTTFGAIIYNNAKGIKIRKNGK